MSSTDPSVPDLASVLQTLAGLTKNQASRPTGSPYQSSEMIQQPWQTPSQVVYPPPPTYQQTALKQPTKVIDPATIIDWSAGLRCVMKTVAKQDRLLSDVRKMIRVQHEHEEQWFQGRKDLVEQQKAREEGRKKIDEVLKLVGGKIASDSVDHSPEALENELKAFDMKVYKAQTQMITEMTARLKNYGIPFFGTRSELVRIPGKKDSIDSKSSASMINESDLIDLQRKMLILLEEMCNE